MPDLSEDTCEDLLARLKKNNSKKNYSNERFIAAGGSAAVFLVDTPNGTRVIKVFDPKFISGKKSSADKRRLDIQRKLIDHSCLYLVQTYDVEEAEETAFIEMEYIDWPSLKNVLPAVPDDRVSSLISQLVEAVKYLEDRNIVHRDIKPENIHISPDFKNLKLLDLGVVREFENNDDYSSTDAGGGFAFLATAQYSSPEYLFRLSEPTRDLWTGLNYYQIGAVLHDLIMKVPLFQSEMESNNRWLLARSVLTKIPSFSCGNNDRLINLKSVSAKCLTKDLATRLSIIDWGLFNFELKDNPLNALKSRIAGMSTAGASKEHLLESRKEYERKTFSGRFYVSIRDTILSACGNEIQLFKSGNTNDKNNDLNFYFSLREKSFVICNVKFEWNNDIYKDFSKVFLSAKFVTDEKYLKGESDSYTLIGEVKLHESENEISMDVCQSISQALIKALDLMEVGYGDVDKDGINLLGESC